MVLEKHLEPNKHATQDTKRTSDFMEVISPAKEGLLDENICDPSREKGPHGNCEKYRHWSACADCAGCPRSKLFAVGRFSVY